MNKVANLYDALKHASKSKGNLFAIHKKMNYADNSINNLYDFILNAYDIPESIDILDCGCGVGFGTLLLAEKTKNKITGISISPDEIDQARKNLLEFPHLDNVKFNCISFDDLKPNSYDLIIAIESLKHSPNLSKSLTSIKNAIRENGQILVIEDIANFVSVDGFASKRLKKDWVLVDLYNEEKYTSDNTFSWTFKDLTGSMHMPSKLSVLIKILAMEIKSLIDKMLFRKKSAATIFRGGFYQDWLYLNKKLSYKIMHGEKLKQE